MKRSHGDIPAGRVMGMEIALAPGFYVATVVLLGLFLVIGIAIFHRSPRNALVGAVLLVLLHWVSETWHNFGHFTAARRTGFPMQGVRLGTALLVFGTSIYPEDEQELPAAVHIRRALGGPIGSAILALLAALALGLLVAAGSSLLWVGVVFTLENLLVFVVANFLPFGFNDGSTMLHWLRQKQP
jgi:Zn-dependent protease